MCEYMRGIISIKFPKCKLKIYIFITIKTIAIKRLAIVALQSPPSIGDPAYLFTERKVTLFRSLSTSSMEGMALAEAEPWAGPFPWAWLACLRWRIRSNRGSVSVGAPGPDEGGGGRGGGGGGGGGADRGVEVSWGDNWGQLWAGAEPVLQHWWEI